MKRVPEGPVTGGSMEHQGSERPGAAFLKSRDDLDWTGGISDVRCATAFC